LTRVSANNVNTNSLIRRDIVKPYVMGYIDELDVEILTRLQANARVSYRTLSKELHVSVTTISERVRALMREGVIRGFTVLVDPEKVGLSHCVSLYVKVKNGFNPKRVGENIGSMREVCYVYNTLGLYDLVALATTASKDDLLSLITKVNSIEGVNEVIPSMVVHVLKEDPKHPVRIAVRKEEVKSPS